MKNIAGHYKRDYLALIWQEKYLENCVYVKASKQPYDEYNIFCICCSGMRGVYKWYKKDGQLTIFNKVPMYKVPCGKLIKIMDLEKLDEFSQSLVAAEQVKWCEISRKKTQPWMLISPKVEIDD